MTLREFNRLDPGTAAAMLLQACGSQEWATQLVAQRPFQTKAELLDAGDRVWLTMAEADQLEAFAAHPRIGEAGKSPFSQAEQRAALDARADVKQRLAELNAAYDRKFGFIFIVFASGKSPEEIVEMLETRLNNDRQSEIRNAAAEQMKITRRRLENMIMAPLPA